MLINNNLIPTQSQPLGLDTPTSEQKVNPASQNGNSHAFSVTLSEKQSNAMRAAEQYEAIIQQHSEIQKSEEPVESMSLSSLPSIKFFNEADVQAYEKKLVSAFAAAGIDTSQKISLTTDFEGNVIVKGDHPDKEKIEAMFAEDTDLRNGFVQTSQHYLFKELYRLNQEWAKKVDAGVDIDLASEWLLSSAKQATAASANGLTLSDGNFSDPYASQGTVARIKSAYGG